MAFQHLTNATLKAFSNQKLKDTVLVERGEFLLLSYCMFWSRKLTEGTSWPHLVSCITLLRTTAQFAIVFIKSLQTSKTMLQPDTPNKFFELENLQ